MPYPKKNEKEAQFISRFMSSEEAKGDFPDIQQRRIVAKSIWDKRHKKKQFKVKKTKP